MPAVGRLWPSGDDDGDGDGPGDEYDGSGGCQKVVSGACGLMQLCWRTTDGSQPPPGQDQSAPSENATSPRCLCLLSV